MADFSFTGRKGGTGSIDTSTGIGSGGTQWNRNPGGIYSKTDQAGKNVWIDPRTKTARDDPMEGFVTGRGGGQFFTDTKGFRLTETGDIFKHPEFGAQRILPPTTEGSPYQKVLFGDKDLYIDKYGVMRSGAMPEYTPPSTPTGPADPVAPVDPNAPPASGAAPGAPIIGDVARGGAPGYPVVGSGGLIGGPSVGGTPTTGGTPGTGDTTGAPGPSTQEGTPGQAPIPAATPYVLGQIQPVTPQPTASAVLSDPIQNRLEQLRGPDQTVAAQTGMTDQMDVNWQMNRILEADNPLVSRAMEQARRDVQTEMNARGLSNTTMAVEIAEQAAWDAAYNIALPMAQDAVKAEQAISAANLQSRAAFQQTGMQLSSQESQQRAQLASGEIIQNLVNNNQITMGEIDRITKLQGIQLSEENKRYLTEITEENKLALQTNASVATAYSNTVTSIGQVYGNPEMYQVDQDRAAQWYMDQFEGYVKFQDIVGQTNYGEQMNWGGGERAGLHDKYTDLEARMDETETLVDENQRMPPDKPGIYDGQKSYNAGDTYIWNADNRQWIMQRF